MTALDLPTLSEAIEAARNYGACRYVDNQGAPQCVIAQYAIRRGLTADELREWDACTFIASNPAVLYALGIFDPYSPEGEAAATVLSALQSAWDDDEGHDFPGGEAGARAAMRAIVAEVALAERPSAAKG